MHRLIAMGVASLLGVASARAASPDLEKNWGFLDKYCSACHNATDWAGSVAFDTLEKDNVGGDAKVWEEAVRKLRGSLMPPPGEPQPDAASRKAFVSSMEHALDAAAATNANPGSVPLHRLNRPEYQNAVRDLLGVEVNAQVLLPRDDQSAGFDNIAEVLKMSPSFLEQYLTAARQVSVEAMGNPNARLASTIYAGAPEAGQYMHMAGLPLGTRGGMVFTHTFPLDAEYEFTVGGGGPGGGAAGATDFTIDGDRASVVSYFLRVDAGVEPGPAFVLASGRYLDDFVRGDDGVWRIRARRCEVENL